MKFIKNREGTNKQYWSKKENITIDADILERRCYYQLYTNTFENIDEEDEF